MGKKRDLAAMAAFAASMYGLNEAGKVDRPLDKMKSAPNEKSSKQKAYWDDIYRKDKKRNDAWWDAQRKREATYDRKPDSDTNERSTDKPVAPGIPYDGGELEVSKPYKKGGAVKSSASKRADGIAQRGKTKGRMV